MKEGNESEKKIITIITLIGIAIGAFTFITFEKREQERSRGVSGAVSYDSLDELMQNSQLTIRGHLINQETFEVTIDDKNVKTQSYEIEIKKVIHNKTSKVYNEGDKITVRRYVSFTIPPSEDSYSLIPEDLNKINNGQYMLFLNEETFNGVSFFVNNSPNHLYKIGNGRAKNIASSHLEEIDVPENTE